MKQLTLFAASAALLVLVSCDNQVNTSPPREVIEKNTTIVTPPAKSENKTVIVTPPAPPENKTIIVNPPGATTTEEKKTTTTTETSR